MNSTGKIVNLRLILLFSLIFISPLRADPLPDEPVSSEEPLSSEGSGALPAPQPSPKGVESEVIGSPLVPQPSPKGEGSPFDDYDAFFEAPPLIFEVPSFETRSLYNIFPYLSPAQRAGVMSSRGERHAFEKSGSPTLVPDQDSGIDLLSSVMAKKPSHIIEALVLIPYNRRKLDFLDIYNALRNVKTIQDHTITIRGNDVKVFVDTTRLESAQRRRPVPDPPRADMLPSSDIMYLRFVDPYIGDLYLRANISVGLYGITYSLSNFRDVTYTIFRIMKAESFSAIIYVEPVREGILIYSMSGIYIPNFIASRVNLTPNMNNRISVLVKWITAGLREEESQRFFYQH
jgi:hypothetical protein